MTLIRVKGFKIFKDRHGKLRCYHRATGHKVDLGKAPLGSAEFIAECERICNLLKAKKHTEPKPGTLGGIIAAYFDTEHFREKLSERTQSDYRKVANYLSAVRDVPTSHINTPLLAAIHDKAAAKIGWKQANMLRTVLSEVFRFAKPKGLVSENYAKDIIPKPRPKNAPRANRPWKVEELDTALRLAPPHIRAVIALIANTGLDPSDALSLRRDMIKDEVIWANRGKTGQEVSLPISGRLKSAMDAAPRHNAITVLANTRGRPWTYNGFSTVWYKWRKDQVEDGALPADLTLKGLRHMVGTILREAGMDLRQIADYLGQKEEAMAAWYSRDADLSERNRAAADLLDAEIERRTKLVKPSLESVKPSGMD